MGRGTIIKKYISFTPVLVNVYTITPWIIAFLETPLIA